MRKKFGSRSSGQSYYLYGKHAALAALANPQRTIFDILCTDKIYAEHSDLIAQHQHKIVPQIYLDNLLKDAIHQGVALQVRPILNSNLSDAIGKACKVAILDQISDPQNIGSIIRSAAAFAIDTIIIPLHGSPAENGVIAKAASGGLEKVNFVAVNNLVQTIQTLKQHGFWVLGLDGEAEQSVNTKDLQGKIALVLGAEGKGMRRLVRENCDLLLQIPMVAGAVESINVANAAAITFFLASDRS